MVCGTQVREEEIDEENRQRIEARKESTLADKATKFAGIQVGEERGTSGAAHDAAHDVGHVPHTACAACAAHDAGLRRELQRLRARLSRSDVCPSAARPPASRPCGSLSRRASTWRSTASCTSECRALVALSIWAGAGAGAALAGWPTPPGAKRRHPAVLAATRQPPQPTAPTAQPSVRPTIVERYADFGSGTYAPLTREGRFPETKPMGQEVETEGYTPATLKV
jgi:hypothetical protein